VEGEVDVFVWVCISIRHEAGMELARTEGVIEKASGIWEVFTAYKTNVHIALGFALCRHDNAESNEYVYEI